MIQRMHDEQVTAYLARIGAGAPARLDAAALRDLQLRHLRSVPFENLSIHLGEPIVLEEAALVDKLVRRRRGGFCYELNGAFAALLGALGYRVTLLEARVIGDGRLGPPYDHMALRVDLDEPWLVDVGFGQFSHHPLRLAVRDEQPDPGGAFRLADAEEGDVDVSADGEAQYRLARRPRRLADFEATSWWHQTSPRSHFTQGTVCSLLTASGRVTLRNRTLIDTADAERRERVIDDDREVLRIYRERFGVELDRVPVPPLSAPARG
jgi:N-hydroxyarylamine O-acetyltransferase